MFESHQKMSDYYDNMNFVVMDKAAYHPVQANKKPNLASLKQNKVD